LVAGHFYVRHQKEAVLLFVVLTAFVVLPLWLICSRAGFSPALSLVALVPFIGLPIVIAMLSFKTWRPRNPVDAEQVS
jgi:hypothetical protein